MGWGGILGAFGDIPQLTARNDDDWIDRLNHRWTPVQLLLFALLVSTKQYVGDPISCWVPKHFSGAWEDYTNSYCWVRNTYYLGWDEEVPTEQASRHNRIIYYQWVPMILMMQALLFHIPISIWRVFNQKTGVDLNDMVETAERYQRADELSLKKKVMDILSRQLDRYLATSTRTVEDECCTLDSCEFSLQSVLIKVCCCVCGKRFGNYLMVLYLLVKLLFLANVIGQLWLLNEFLGQDYNMYGVHVIDATNRGEDMTQSARFPRVTMCDFDIRRLGNIHSYTVQCVLPINLFNEKIYLYIWFWLVFLSALNVWGLVRWLIRFTVIPSRYHYILQQLSSLPLEKFDPERSSDKRLLYHFTRNYLKQDGYLVVKLVDLNTNKMTSSDLLCSIWEGFLNKPNIHKHRMERDEDI